MALTAGVEAGRSVHSCFVALTSEYRKEFVSVCCCNWRWRGRDNTRACLRCAQAKGNNLPVEEFGLPHAKSVHVQMAAGGRMVVPARSMHGGSMGDTGQAGVTTHGAAAYPRRRLPGRSVMLLFSVRYRQLT